MRRVVDGAYRYNTDGEFQPSPERYGQKLGNGYGDGYGDWGAGDLDGGGTCTAERRGNEYQYLYEDWEGWG